MRRLRSVLPWIFWIIVLMALTTAGTHHNATGLGTTNPRSYEARKSTTASSGPCP